jgi:hypothetical protein
MISSYVQSSREGRYRLHLCVLRTAGIPGDLKFNVNLKMQTADNRFIRHLW